MHEDLIALFPDLLAKHVVKLTVRGDRARGVCPFHESNNPMSFSASLSKGVWSCWSCGKNGGVVDFARHVGADLPGHRSPSSPLHTVSAALQHRASADFRAWKLERYLDAVELLGSSPDFDGRRAAIAALDKYDPNPMADETEARAEYAAIIT